MKFDSDDEEQIFLALIFEIQHNGSKAVGIIRSIADDLVNFKVSRVWIYGEGFYKSWWYYRENCKIMPNESKKIPNRYKGGKKSKIPENIIKRVIEYRKKDGYSQQKIADIIGLSRKQVRRILEKLAKSV